MNSAAAVSKASENAICATTSGLRGKNRHRRRTKSSPACSFKSSTTELRESFIAGPSAKQTVPSRQNPNVTARTGKLGPPFHTTSKGIRLVSDRASKPEHQTPSINPPTPPRRASSNPSVNNCRTMRHRLPPSARRKAISLRRAVPRASNMLARFKHATNKTTAAIPIKSGAIAATSLSSGGSSLMEKRDNGAVVKV